MLRFLCAFFRFDLFPASQDFFAIICGKLAKNMGMAALQFVADGSADIVKIEAAFFLRHLRVKHHLKQQVAQFAAQIVKILTRNRIQYFISFFKRIGRNTGKGLFFIPWATGLRVAQALHDGEQASDLVL